MFIQSVDPKQPKQEQATCLQKASDVYACFLGFTLNASTPNLQIVMTYGSFKVILNSGLEIQKYYRLHCQRLGQKGCDYENE